MRPCPWYFLLLLSASCLVGAGQSSFKTVAPARPVITGESFQVQYILESPGNFSGFSFPSFSGCRLVAGPTIYSGERPSENGMRIFYRNTVFTLCATRAGHLRIAGAGCVVNGKPLKSNDVSLKVIAADDQPESTYVLKPGEDPYKKISENLFLKLTVDKQICFIGEPVVATFKLYSRLQSRSNVVKNPGFYGFSVYDMLNVSDQVESRERLKGQWFDVHTIRKLQLYPLQAGRFTIDAMELDNEVEFSRGRSGQQVTENMYGSKDEESDNVAGNTYKANVASNRLAITVMPLPGRAPADSFKGAVGKFTITSFIGKTSIKKNEEDSLVVRIRGNGNFQRVTSPLVQWPKGFEVFDPVIKDTFDKQQVPLEGEREFRYVFVSDKPGTYKLPPISFSYFDTQARSFRTMSTAPLVLSVVAGAEAQKTAVGKPAVAASHGKSNSWWLAAAAIIAFIIVATWVTYERKQISIRQKKQQQVVRLVSVADILAPARQTCSSENKIFYDSLARCLWNYFNERIGKALLPLKRSELGALLASRGVPGETIESLMVIMDHCQVGVYTQADTGADKTALLEKASSVLEEIDASATAT